MRFIAVVLLAAFAERTLAYQVLTEKDCEMVGKIIEQKKTELMPQVDVILHTYVPSITEEHIRAIKVFVQKLDGKSICERALVCGADFSCMVRRWLQGIGDTLLSVPELEVTESVLLDECYPYCDKCQSSMPTLRQAYLQDKVRALLKQNTRSLCAKFYSKKHCVQEIKWFGAHYEELVRLLTTSTTCDDLKLCSSDDSTSL